MRNRLKARGFTLIELLVVVAIIGLLISILLPSLARAKEQAKIAKCLSNIRNIVGASAAYLSDDADDLVFTWPIGYVVGAEGSQRNYTYYTEFIWGGGVPDTRDADWDEQSQGSGSPFKGQGADIFYYTPKERPLNNYVTPDVSWDDPLRVKKQNAYRRDNPMVLPDIFKCPSDSTAGVPEAGSSNDTPESDSVYETWRFWGNSYPINWYWGYHYTEGRDAPLLATIAGNRTKGIQGLGKELIRKEQGFGAAEFILFYENQMNMAVQGARPRGFPRDDVANQKLPGWHKQENMHVAAFLDGHAEYRMFDTTYVDGPGWTTWPHRPWIPFWAEYEDN